MRIAWTPQSLVRGAGVLDHVSTRALPPVPTNGLPWSLAAQVHDAVSSSDGVRVRVSTTARDERGHLLTIARTGDGRGGAIRVDLATLRAGHKRVSSISGWLGRLDKLDRIEQKVVRRYRAWRAGNPHLRAGRYRDPFTQRLIVRTLRNASKAKYTKVLGPVGGPRASAFLKGAAKASPQVLKVGGRVLGGVGVAFNAYDSITSFRDASKITDPAARRQKYIDSGVSAAGAAGAVMMMIPFPPVQLAGAAITAGVLVYQNREAIRGVATQAAGVASDTAKSLGRTLRKLF